MSSSLSKEATLPYESIEWSKVMARQGCGIRGNLDEGNPMQLLKSMSEDAAKAMHAVRCDKRMQRHELVQINCRTCVVCVYN